MPPSRRNVLFGIMSLPAASLAGRRPLPGLTATVYNGHELRAAFQAAGAGSVITLAPGDFGDVGPFALSASEVSLRAQAPLRTALRSTLVVQGSSVDLDGLGFEDGLVLAGNGLSVANGRVGGRGVLVAGSGASLSNNQISGGGGSFAISVGGSARGPRITNNYIRNCRAAIGLGVSMATSNTRVGALVQGNRIEDCTGGSETIMVKCSGNTITGNQLRNCNNVTNRHGEGNQYANNTMERCLCIVIHDRNNRVVGNRAVSPKLARSFRVMGGNVTADSTNQGAHPQAVNTYLSGNSGGTLEIGAVFQGDNLPAVNTTVASHGGGIRLLRQVGTRLPGGGGAA
jgi:hypothetical protein